MDAISKVFEEGVEAVFSRNEKVRSMLQGKPVVALQRERLHGRDKVFCDRCHSLEIERFHGVGMPVVVRISE